MSSPGSLHLDVISDSGPFSTLGKSIGYRIRVEEAEFLVDCGAPVFSLLGPQGLESIDGVVGTHAHEDHKRWFSDLALFRKYTSGETEGLPLLGAPEILREYRRSCAPALEQTLSPDSRQVVNFSFRDFVDPIFIGPEPRYRCKKLGSSPGNYQWRVVDQNDEPLPPDRARVVFAEGVEQPRMLFRDPREEIWVEPSVFYSYDDERFYDLDSPGAQGHTHDSGLRIQAVKSTAWHGPPTHSIQVEYQGETIFFTSDTVYNPSLWEELVEPLDPPESPGTGTRANQPCLVGDMNDFLQKRWSKRRLERARQAYRENPVIIHDVTSPPAIVHSDYQYVEQVDNTVVLTHSPDRFTALDPLAHLGKSYEIRGGELYEQTEAGDQYQPNAVCYHKEGSQYYVGYPDENGGYHLVRSDPGDYSLQPVTDEGTEGEILEQVRLYEELGGDYYPSLKDSNQYYVRRSDGRVEKRSQHAEGTEGRIVKGVRASLASPPVGATDNQTGNQP